MKIIILGLSILLTGCVSLDVTKAVNINGKEIYIIENPYVRTDFLTAYKKKNPGEGV